MRKTPDSHYEASRLMAAYSAATAGDRKVLFAAMVAVHQAKGSPAAEQKRVRTAFEMQALRCLRKLH